MVIGLGQLTLLGLFGGALFAGNGPEPMVAAEVQHVRPTAPDRQLDLINATWFFGEKHVLKDRLDLQLGATVTRATGSIIQLTGSYEEGTLRAETLGSAAWGLGPTVKTRVNLAELSRMSLNLDASGSLMLYDRAFPSGGTRYNGMVQAGPSVSWSLERGRILTVGARWTHISNGQGLGGHNPSYDGRGLFVQLERDMGNTRRGRL